jgi:hypothetical protein
MDLKFDVCIGLCTLYSSTYQCHVAYTKMSPMDAVGLL